MLGAMFTILCLYGATIYIIYESIERIMNQDEPIHPLTMLIIAIVSFFAHLLMLVILKPHIHDH